jgi:hypothetical protein
MIFRFHPILVLMRRFVRLVFGVLPPRVPNGIHFFELGLWVAGVSLEWLRRHGLVIRELENIRRENRVNRMTVLDFGGASGSLAAALRLYGLDRQYRLILADVDESAVVAARVDGLLVQAITLDPGKPIPLANGSIDVAVSIDVFEHIPPEDRAFWASELSRVARLGQIHTFPADSCDGRWASTAADRRLDTWYRIKYGMVERWTAEHLSHNQPDVDEMTSFFPNVTVRGFASTEVWFEMLSHQLATPTLAQRLRFAFRYAFTLSRCDQNSPWKACLITCSASGRH